MFAGQMGCEGLNFLLKRLIKGERPPRKEPLGTSRLTSSPPPLHTTEADVSL